MGVKGGGDDDERMCVLCVYVGDCVVWTLRMWTHFQHTISQHNYNKLEREILWKKKIKREQKARECV
jgi:hypothetical protein